MSQMADRGGTVSVVRVGTWVAVVTLGGVTLYRAQTAGWTSDVPYLMFFYVCGGAAFVLHVIHDHWDKNHRLSRLLGVVAISTAVGAGIATYLRARVFEGRSQDGSSSMVETGPSGPGPLQAAQTGHQEPLRTAALSGPSAAPGGDSSRGPSHGGRAEGQAGTRVDLRVAYAVEYAPATLGTMLTTYLTVKNSRHAPASNVRASLTLSQGMVVKDATANRGTCSSQTRMVTCALDTLASGDSVTIPVVVELQRAGTFQATAHVTSAESDLHQADNTALTTTVVLP